MRRYAGQTVSSGYYLNRKSWEIVTVGGGGATLSGNPGDTYWRLSIFVLLALAPLMGALLVAFLPFIGIAMFLWTGVRWLAHLVWQNVTAAFRRGACYL